MPLMHRNNPNGEWKEENLLPFTELMISWNSSRPSRGAYSFYVSVKTADWSPWLLYAKWGSDGQSSFSSPTISGALVSVYQDALAVLGEEIGSGFRVKGVAEGDASLDQVRALHVYTNGTQGKKGAISYSSSLLLPVKGLSQMALDHPRRLDLCSPTSITAVIRYLAKTDQLDPALLAQRVWDSGFDIYGNWILNVAEAAAHLGPRWNAWVERLGSFDDIYLRLQGGIPVIVSVRGPLVGSAAPYAGGHLVAVIGYEQEKDRVICMDPRFPSDQETHVGYDRADFLQAWDRRGKIAYVFEEACPKESFSV